MNTRFATAFEIRAAIANKAVTAEVVTRDVLKTIREEDGNIGAFLETFDDEAIASAKAIDEMIARGEELPRLAGVPVALKDNMLVKGHRATSGSRILKDYVAPYDATVVARLKAAGAIIVGRTNMDEFAMGSSTETSAWQKTFNPWDTSRIPGGSSGGSCAAVAAGFVPIALGSDTGGSVRQPAALCGIVGLKPSYGRVSRYGLMALASSFDQIAPFARTVADAALALEVIEGEDERDATSVSLSETTVPELMSPTLKGVKVGVPKEFFIDGMDEDVRSTVLAALETMREQGAEIVDISLPLLKVALPAYYIIQPAEACSNLGRFDGMRYGTRAPGSLEASYLEARGEGFGREAKRRIMLGAFILSAGYVDAYYKKALAVRAALKTQFDNAFKEVDVIVGPTSPVVAWKVGEKFDDPMAMYLADVFTVATNVIGIAGISIPCGFAHGLPVGLQIQANHLEEGKMISVAAAYEAATQWHEQVPVQK
ncbi:MAG: Glutamyl-tRNA(Gln) amidotransferase subunit A [Candidatus Uhrbacteria bacterium GW2011_GWD2_52_7]|uniref:Glutamyl-tRNA(Gln) amidotransferase subunit A n=1 Tax=Candidatus Uhrbacteria bacterium GW2011_GWD2_52_7 TaxID=1618989 RepID=A0A0G1XDE7_9BACT|nr:MAG: Glutamyl-tRNA(Gln) amidotransferase subunit A [Candidatus Uhrbacteria bacterium GW2011_GWD2_52_7]